MVVQGIMSTVAILIFDAPTYWPLVVSAGVVVTAAMIWLYPPQIRTAGMLAWLPVGLRWMALAALVLALLKPVLLVPDSSLDTGAVVLMVDCSRSMSVVDSGRTPAERVSLAAALGRLPQGLRDGSGAALLEQINRAQALANSTLAAQSDLEYARVSGRGIRERQSTLHKTVQQFTQVAQRLAAMAASAPPVTKLLSSLREIAVVPPPEAKDAWMKIANRLSTLNESAQAIQRKTDMELYLANQEIRRDCDELSRSSRFSLAQLALFDSGHGLVRQLPGNGPVLFYALGAKIQPTELSRENPNCPVSRFIADADKSDLVGGVGAVLSAETARPPKAIVLVSDGRQVAGRGDLATTLRPSGVPVFTINVAPAEVPDAWIHAVSLSGATGVFAGENVDGQIEVRCRGLVQLPKFVDIEGTAGRRQAILTPRARSEGQSIMDLTAHFSIPAIPSNGRPFDKLVFSIPAVPSEVTTDNNRVERFVKVFAERVNVLMCGAELTRDFQFLSAALINRPWVRAQTQSLDSEHPRLKLSPAELRQQDVVVLGDVPVTALDVNQWDALHRLVNEGGGSIIIISGPSDAPADYVQQPIAAALLPFHDVRPAWKTWPGQQAAFRFLPTPLGEREALRLADGGDEASRWQELPALYRYLQVPEKNLFPDVRQLLLEMDSGSPVLMERRIGAGSVLFMGLQETWRWRSNAGEAIQDRFWRQLVRHAAGERYASRNGPLSLDIDRMACEPGEKITVRARVASAMAGTLPLEVRRDGRNEATVWLRAVGEGRFSGELRDLAAGNYQFRIHGTGRNAKAVAAVPLQVAPSGEAEMRDVSSDPGMLRRITRASGGESLSIDQISQLPRRLKNLREGEAQSVQKPLYNSPLLFIFILSCLSGEWALRKRVGLA